MQGIRTTIARLLRRHRPVHAASRSPLPILASIPVVALCGAIALTSDSSASAAADSAAAARSASAAAAATAVAPVPDGRLPRTAGIVPALPPLGVPARLLHSSPSAISSPTHGRQPVAAIVSALASSGIPLPALQAYRGAARRLAVSDPGCHLAWPLLAGIGRVESNHGRFGGAQLRADGTSTRPIIGIPLNGNGTAVIRDTDHGALDGDPVWDRAVGPMQFIPSTWQRYASDGNGDGRADPFNIFDAALATARYLCVAGGDVGTSAGEERAILSYNHSYDYLRLVVAMARDYAAGTPATIPALPPLPAGAGSSTNSPSGSKSHSGSGSSSSSAGSSTPHGSSSSSTAPSGSQASSSSSASSPASSAPSSSAHSSSAPSSSAPSSSATSSSSTSSAAPSSASSSASPSCTASRSSSTSASANGSTSGSQSGSSSTQSGSSGSGSSTASPSGSACPTT